MGVRPSVPVEGDRVTSGGGGGKGGSTVVTVAGDVAGGEVGHWSVGVIWPHDPLDGTENRNKGKKHASQHCGRCVEMDERTGWRKDRCREGNQNNRSHRCSRACSIIHVSIKCSDSKHVKYHARYSPMSTSELSEGDDGSSLRKGFEANHVRRESDLWRVEAELTEARGGSKECINQKEGKDSSGKSAWGGLVPRTKRKEKKGRELWRKSDRMRKLSCFERSGLYTSSLAKKSMRHIQCWRSRTAVVRVRTWQNEFCSMMGRDTCLDLIIRCQVIVRIGGDEE